MKLHPEPSAEFENNAITRWDRFILYSLERSASDKPCSITAFWAVFWVFNVGLDVRHADQDFQIDPLVSFIFITAWLYSLTRIYTSRATLTMMRRGRAKNEPKIS